MKDLTIEDKETLLRKIKSFLGITWEDDETDEIIMPMIISSISYLDDVCGCELDYIHTSSSDFEDKTYSSASLKAQELLFNRVFYMREKALDDFDKNYRSSLVGLNLLGRVIKDAKQS